MPLIFRIDSGASPISSLDFARHALGLGARQVDLVQARDQLEARLDREVGVGDRLRLDPLRGVDDQQRPLAGGQRARDLVGEVDVPGRVDQVQLVGLAVARGEEHAHRLRLDRDAALALEVHRVEQLRAHLARGDRVRQLEDAVGQRRLAVVDVGDDREVADVRLVHGPRHDRWWHRASTGGSRGAARSGALALSVRRIANSTRAFEVQPRLRAGLRAGGLSRCRECHAAQANDTSPGT